MAAQESTTPAANDASVAACCHHWSIQPATGPLSQGVCKLCGEVREFKNYVEAATWGDSRLSNKSTSDDSQTAAKPAPAPAKAEASEAANEDDE